MLGGPPTRSGFPPPSGRVTPPRYGLVLLRRSHFPLTAAVIRQSAVDLFGTDSATHRAVDQALYAVGL